MQNIIFMKPKLDNNHYRNHKHGQNYLLNQKKNTVSKEETLAYGSKEKDHVITDLLSY
jgi:hypothetical protein